jgi:thiol-disulfide isomerase/thioredoxin
MKKNAIALMLIAFVLSGSLDLLSQEAELNRVINDPEQNEDILIGYCNRSGLEGAIFGAVFQEYYRIYEPDKEITAKMKGLTDSVFVLIVMGTWCSDSEEQVPKFFKVLDKIRFSSRHLTVICVDSQKKAGDVDISKYDVHRVPTFIVFRNEREVGRIIETPVMSLEKDLLLLLTD